LRPGDSVVRRDNEASLTTDADRSSLFIGLVIVDIFVGLADAITGPYIVLFLVDQAGFNPLSLSAILTARALSGIVFSTAFGAWIDKRATVAPLMLALAGSAIGYALLGFTTDFAALLLIAAIPVAIGAAAFSQSIALAKRNFSQANPHTVNRAIGVLRASWSLAWAIGPAIGAILIGVAGFRGAFFASALSGAIALATLAFVSSRVVLADVGHARPPKPVNGGPAIALAFAALALFHTAMFLGSIPLPIVLTTSLGGVERDVGITMSLCAGLEIVVMGALIWKPLQRGERLAIVAGFAAFIAYFVALTLVHSVAGVFWAQILRAIGIAFVSYLGISFLHSLMPHRAGAAAALFSNSGQVGSVLAALSVGGLAKAFGYASIFAVCAVLSAAGLALVCLTPAEPD
jgi:MFS transporter, SET family, sugar efflux transporter